jgi:starch-binding outer membrane protein, SusD/RagB family
MKDATKDVILGKAYFYRAYHYYRLVHQFGDIPTSFKELAEPKLDFQTVKREVILQKIKSDLDFAVKVVPFVGNKGDVNRGAIGHLLTKVNLALGLYDEAIASADLVINSGTFKLVTARFGADAGNPARNVIWDLHRPVNKFLPNNTEVLFSSTDRFGLTSATTTGTTSMRQATPFLQVRTF